jgi:hypothetical protein
MSAKYLDPIRCQTAIETTAYLTISREMVTTLKHFQKLGLSFSVAP